MFWENTEKNGFIRSETMSKNKNLKIRDAKINFRSRRRRWD